jgi:hypothetical protein
MLLHLTVISLQCAAVGAFLILWYFWAKKKLLCSFMVQDEEQILFPFRYFSWILMGVVLGTCLVQLHFVRTSSQIHERLVGLTNAFQKQEQDIRAMQGLADSMDHLRGDVSALANEVRNRTLKQMAQGTAPQAPGLSPFAHSDPSDMDLKHSSSGPASPGHGDGFASEAKASSVAEAKRPLLTGPRKAEEKEDPNGFSMRLNRMGHITTGNLRVRKRPVADSPVMEKLGTGDPVKVTEKRLFKDNMWFRVITPSGRAGWVDFRYVKLGGDA